MKLFNAFDLIVLSYCLAADFIGVVLPSFPTFKLLSSLVVILVAHRISWKSLIYINTIDLAVVLALNIPKVMLAFAIGQSAPAETFLIFGTLVSILGVSPFLATAFIKFINKLAPKKLKRDRVGY